MAPEKVALAMGYEAPEDFEDFKADFSANWQSARQCIAPRSSTALMRR
jgi:hypothetical protein